VSLLDQANLIVAALDLNLVRLLRAAMAPIELPGAPAGPGAVSAAATYEPPQHIHLDPIIEPREHIYLRPLIEPRPIIHLKPAVEPDGPSCVATESRDARATECRPDATFPIQPPWAILPWQEAPKAQVHVKVVRYRTDIISKGSLIDCFI